MRPSIYPSNGLPDSLTIFLLPGYLFFFADGGGGGDGYEIY